MAKTDELLTLNMGKLYGIDLYDQSAVELGKQFTFHLMGRKGYERPPVDL